MRKPRQKDHDGILWFTGIVVLGALWGYSKAGDGRGHMAIVGATMGAFVGTLVLMEVAGTPIAASRWIGGGAGIAAACICSFVQHWTTFPTLVAGVIGGVVGAFSHRWAKDISFP